MAMAAITNLDLTQTATKQMDSRCPCCGNYHEIGRATYFGTEILTCPELAENEMVAMRKVPVVVHGPQGEKFESFRYEFVGLEGR